MYLRNYNLLIPKCGRLLEFRDVGEKAHVLKDQSPSAIDYAGEDRVVFGMTWPPAIRSAPCRSCTIITTLLRQCQVGQQHPQFPLLFLFPLLLLFYDSLFYSKRPIIDSTGLFCFNHRLFTNGHQKSKKLTL
jgi:hypothetical protein